jgi:hypothetical protein
MSTFVRVWCYRTVERLANEDCKISETNQPVVKEVIGEFRYYECDGEISTRPCYRKEAQAWADKARKKIKTLYGYPAWMHDLGYRV